MIPIGRCGARAMAPIPIHQPEKGRTDLLTRLRRRWRGSGAGCGPEEIGHIGPRIRQEGVPSFRKGHLRGDGNLTKQVPAVEEGPTQRAKGMLVGPPVRRAPN